MAAVLAFGLGPLPVHADAPAFFSAEARSAVMYHVIEIPQPQVGGEGLAWSSATHTDTFGRALVHYSGVAANAVLESTVPQTWPDEIRPYVGNLPFPLAGFKYSPQGAKAACPPSVGGSCGEAQGKLDVGNGFSFPLGLDNQSPVGRTRVLGLYARAERAASAADVALGSFEGQGLPAGMGVTFGRALTETRRDGEAVVSRGVSLVHGLVVGDLSISWLRSEARVRVGVGIREASWSVELAGVRVAGQEVVADDRRLRIGSDVPDWSGLVASLNAQLAAAAANSFSEVRLMPGRVFEDEGRLQAESGWVWVAHANPLRQNDIGHKIVASPGFVTVMGSFRLTGGEAASEMGGMPDAEAAGTAAGKQGSPVSGKQGSPVSIGSAEGEAAPPPGGGGLMSAILGESRQPPAVARGGKGSADSVPRPWELTVLTLRGEAAARTRRGLGLLALGALVGLGTVGFSAVRLVEVGGMVRRQRREVDGGG